MVTVGLGEKLRSKTSILRQRKLPLPPQAETKENAKFHGGGFAAVVSRLFPSLVLDSEYVGTYNFILKCNLL